MRRLSAPATLDFDEMNVSYFDEEEPDFGLSRGWSPFSNGNGSQMKEDFAMCKRTLHRSSGDIKELPRPFFFFFAWAGFDFLES